jgi:hypothetical protein
MAGTRVLSEFTYTSGVSPSVYYFTVLVDQNDLVSVRNIQSPFGLIIDSMTSVPESVMTDITSAITQVEGLLAATSAINGILTFSAETSKAVAFATALTTATYRVQLDSSAFVGLRVTGKTMTGFTVEATAAFTGTVGYDLFL